MKKRRYTLKRRAAEQQATRDRIVEAAMQLHGEIGPRNTTISAIAERAGVQRLTVYRHFPDDGALFHACSARWLELNPPPDPASWHGADGAPERTSAALLALYRYYRGTQRMWERVYRDADLAALRAPLGEFHAYLDSIGAELGAAWRPTGRKPTLLTATIRHALEFATWRSLTRRGVGDRRASRLVTAWIEKTAALP